MTCNEFRRDLLDKQISIVLSTLGMSEQYISFKYLHTIVSHMIANENDSLDTYRTLVNAIKHDNQISSRTISFGLNKILSMCNNTIITTRSQFNLSHHSTYNKIKTIKTYIFDL